MMMNKTNQSSRRGALARLSLALAGCGTLATPILVGPETVLAAPSGSVPAAAQANTQDQIVREFYDWYLPELHAGRKPYLNDARLKAYLTDEKIVGMQMSMANRFDPVLLLPLPSSDWHGMKVTVGKPYFHRGPGAFDAYVDVTYKGFAGRPQAIDVNTVGLSKTAAGWRIASISIKD